jgi:ATP-binding cassette, subfamily B, bacterial MsbA
MKHIRAIFKFLNGKWTTIITFIITNLLSVIFSMLSLAMLVPFLNLLFGKDELVTINPGWEWSQAGASAYFKYWMSSIVISHQNNKMWALGFICIAVFSSILLKNTFLFYSRYILHPLRNAIVRNLRNDLFNKLLFLPIGYFTNERKGDIMARFTNDIREVEDSIVSTMDLLFSVPFTVLFYIIFMLSLSVKLCLFLIILLPIAGFLIGRMSKKLKSQSTDNSLRIGTLLSILDETLGGLRIIKAFGAEKMQQIKYVKENNYLNKLNNNIALRREAASPLSETLAIIVLCIILWFGGKLVLQNQEIDGGTFILFILIFTQLIEPLKKLSQIFYNIQKGSASLERIELILQAQDTVQESAHPIALKSFQQKIEFQHVSFNYGDNAILKNVNFEIIKGQNVAIVGASGSGKSTMVDLIPRFHDVSKGAILLDGVNIKDYVIKDIRSLFGVVSQEPILFNDTISNNIALGSNAAISEEAISAAATVANAHKFINNKPEGYKTNIGDRGSKLSGGEKQRLTIARAVLKNPPILILDEATSSLDTESEKLVQDAIDSIMKHRTCIIIAHRLSTVKNADKIIVLDKGAIIEEGSHDDLIAKKGQYYKLVQLQQLN